MLKDFKEIKEFLKTNTERPTDWQNTHSLALDTPRKPRIFLPYTDEEKPIFNKHSKKNPSNTAVVDAIDPSKPIWLAESNKKTIGPFSVNEIEYKITSKLFDADVKVKRKKDDKFLSFELVKRKLKNLAELNSMFSEENVKERVVLMPIEIRLSKGFKVSKFLAGNNAKITNARDVYMIVKGKTREEGINALNKRTGLNNKNNVALLSIFISEIGRDMLKK